MDYEIAPHECEAEERVTECADMVDRVDEWTEERMPETKEQTVDRLAKYFENGEFTSYKAVRGYGNACYDAGRASVEIQTVMPSGGLVTEAAPSSGQVPGAREQLEKIAEKHKLGRMEPVVYDDWSWEFVVNDEAMLALMEAGEAYAAPLRREIEELKRKLVPYDPRRDERSCDMSKGDVQCDWILPNMSGSGHLCCAFKINHAGEHHTCYAVDEKHLIGKWRRKSGRELAELRKQK